MNCPSCNKELKENMAVCENCGEVLIKRERGNLLLPPNPVTRPLKTWDFILMILVGAVPVVNIIVYLVWAFSSRSNLNRKSFARAILILFLVEILLTIGSLFILEYFYNFNLPMIYNYYL